MLYRSHRGLKQNAKGLYLPETLITLFNVIYVSVFTHQHIYTSTRIVCHYRRIKISLNDESTVNIVNQITYTVVQKNPETM